MLHPYNGTLLRNKKEQTVDLFNDLDESPGKHVSWKSQFPPNYILYDSIIIYPLNGKTMDTEKRLVVATVWGGEKRGEWGYKRAA